MGKKTLATISLIMMALLFVAPSYSQPPSPESMVLSGNIRFTDFFTIGTEQDFYTFPSGDGTAGFMLVTDGIGTVSWGQATAASIEDGTITPVKFSGITTDGVDGDVLGSDGAGGFKWTTGGTPGEFLLRMTSAYIVVNTTDVSTAAENGANLLAAYDYARTNFTNPNGVAISATNRATVLVLPGRYDLGDGQLLLDTDFIDVVGLSSASADQHIIGTTDGTEGVVTQSAGNVRIENLTIQCNRLLGSLTGQSTDPAAYYPADGGDFSNTIIRNCQFLANDNNAWSMRVGVGYAGTYEDCSAASYSFGGTASGTASGDFFKCTGGEGAFGGSGGTADGIFRDCVGGDEAFGGGGGSGSGGIFWDCDGGADSFGDGAKCDGCLRNGDFFSGTRDPAF